MKPDTQLPTSFTSSRLIQAAALLFAALAALFLVREVREMNEFGTWVREVQAELVAKPVPASRPEEAFAMRMMSSVNGRLCGLLSKNKPGTPMPKGGLSLKSSSDQLRDPSGACASFSHVLAKCLLTAGIDVRKVGLQSGQQKAVHHVIEAKLDGHWALMDPLFCQTFRGRDGLLADARVVGQDWAFFSQQLVAGYDRTFDYSGFYHTNWDRIPVIGWLVKNTPGLEGVLERRRVSVRMWFFNVNRWLGSACLLISVALWCWSRRRAGAFSGVSAVSRGAQ